MTLSTNRSEQLYLMTTPQLYGHVTISQREEQLRIALLLVQNSYLARHAQYFTLYGARLGQVLATLATPVNATSLSEKK